MKIINLIEDTEGESGYAFEHGLSFYIETASHKLILDTGASDAFIGNAEKKGIDLKAIDTVVISHGHYDHTGGLLAFSKLNPKAEIYIHEKAVGDFYNFRHTPPKYIGMDPEISKLSNAVFIRDNFQIDGELSLFSDVVCRHKMPRGNSVLKRRVNNEFHLDDFSHEQYLVVTEGDKKVLLSGCAHRGVINILNRYKELFGGAPAFVISGFHTVMPEYGEEDDQLIRSVAEELSLADTKFYSGHCTGEHPLRIMKEIMGDKLSVLHSGDDILDI